MAKTLNECDSIYFYEWNGKNTGYKYRLYFIPSYDADLSSAYNVYKLPTGLIMNLNYDWEFDKSKYIGAPKFPAIEFDVNLSLLDGATLHPEFNIFAKLIYESTATISFTKQLDYFSFDMKLITGNVWYLIVDYTGVGDTWNCIFAGSQEQKAEKSIDFAQNIMKVEVTDLSKSVAEKLKGTYIMNFHGKQMTYGNNGRIIYIDNYFDAIIEGIDKKGYFMGLTPTVDGKIMKIGVSSFYDFNKYLEDLLHDILRKYLRYDSEFTYSIDYGNQYKQKYDSSKTRGSSLSADNPYFISYIQKYDKKIKSYKSHTDGGALIELFGDSHPTLWDYLVDLVPQTIKNLWSYYTLTGTLLTGVSLENTILFKSPQYRTKIKASQIIDFNCEIDAEKISSINISIKDKKGDDYENISYPFTATIKNENIYGLIVDLEYQDENSSTRTENNYEIPLYLHNLPTIYNNATIEKEPNKLIGQWIISSDFHNLVLLYKDKPKKQDGKSFWYKDVETWIRVHQKCSFSLGNNYTSDDLLIHIYDQAYILDKYIGKPYIKLLWIFNGWAMILAQTYYTLFNHKGQNKISGKTFLENGINKDISESNYNIWFDMPNAHVDLGMINNPAPYDIMFETMNTQYKLTKVKCSLISEYSEVETVEFEALSTWEGI